MPKRTAPYGLLIEQAFARAEHLEAEAARARALLDRLQSDILARAFAGELVPQDPNDEPAAVLFGRIRAQRAAAPPRYKTNSEFHAPFPGKSGLDIEAQRKAIIDF